MPKKKPQPKATPIPPDMVDYLITLISPPDEKAVFLGELSDVDFKKLAETPEKSVAGYIVRGNPTDAQSQALYRVLKPGAHLLLIAPDEQPTGHTGACTIEDNGFEIRDAILWVREAGYFHYVPKAARSEREAGCQNLESKTGAEAAGREEGAASLNTSGRTGAGSGSKERIHNFHPTVKPKDLMERLLHDIPKGEGPVLDPFMGSGSTGLGCIQTGHDFIGIEREEDFAKIATARARYWVKQRMTDASGRRDDAPSNIKVESDVEVPSDEVTEVELESIDAALLALPVKQPKPKKSGSGEGVDRSDASGDSKFVTLNQPEDLDLFG